MLIKRLMDVAVAASALIVLSPVLLAIMALVAAGRNGPLFFRQRRAGRYGHPFTLTKFRSMIDVRDASGSMLCDGARLTLLGRWLRSTSLDELPELWHVLVGQMSLVGPRPLLMRYLDLYSPEQARRHEVRPGLTGYAQINGRNAISWDAKLTLDTWYVDHRSLRLDLQIIAATVVQVVSRAGIGAPGEATMSEFTGSAELIGIDDDLGRFVLSLSKHDI